MIVKISGFGYASRPGIPSNKIVSNLHNKKVAPSILIAIDYIKYNGPYNNCF